MVVHPACACAVFVLNTQVCTVHAGCVHVCLFTRAQMRVCVLLCTSVHFCVHRCVCAGVSVRMHACCLCPVYSCTGARMCALPLCMCRCVQMLHVCTTRHAGTRARVWDLCVCTALCMDTGARVHSDERAGRPACRTYACTQTVRVGCARAPRVCKAVAGARAPCARVCRIQPGFSEWLEPAALPAGVSVPSALGAAAAQVGGAGPAAPPVLPGRAAPAGLRQLSLGAWGGPGKCGGRRAVPPRPPGFPLDVPLLARTEPQLQPGEGGARSRRTRRPARGRSEPLGGRSRRASRGRGQGLGPPAGPGSSEEPGWRQTLRRAAPGPSRSRVPSAPGGSRLGLPARGPAGRGPGVGSDRVGRPGPSRIGRGECARGDRQREADRAPRPRRSPRHVHSRSHPLPRPHAPAALRAPGGWAAPAAPLLCPPGEAPRSLRRRGLGWSRVLQAPGRAAAAPGSSAAARMGGVGPRAAAGWKLLP